MSRKTSIRPTVFVLAVLGLAVLRPTPGAEALEGWVKFNNKKVRTTYGVSFRSSVSTFLESIERSVGPQGELGAATKTLTFEREVDSSSAGLRHAALDRASLWKVTFELWPDGQAGNGDPAVVYTLTRKNTRVLEVAMRTTPDGRLVETVRLQVHRVVVSAP